MKAIFVIITLLSASAAQADVYKCVENGKQVFSDQPCAKDAQKLNVKPASGHSDEVTSEQAVAASKAFVDKVNKDGKRRDLDNEIERTEREIARLNDEKDNKIAALQQKKLRANNNIAGAIWEQSITTEMVAITNDYNTKISSAEKNLAALRARRSALN